MAVSINQKIKQLRQVRLSIAANRKEAVTKLVADMATLLKRRIQTKGADFEGNQYPAYSTPYAKLRNKSTSRGGLGVQSNFVDFTVTGRMMASIQPQVTESDDRATTVVLKPGDAENQTKLNGQFRKRGNILTPSQSEIDLLNRLNQERITKELNKL